MLVPSTVRRGVWYGRPVLWALEPGYLDSLYVARADGRIDELALWVGWAEA